MKRKTMLALALVTVTGIAVGAIVFTSSNQIAFGDDEYRTTSLTMQTGYTEPGYLDVIAAFASTATQDATGMCRIVCVRPGTSDEEPVLDSPSEQAFGVMNNVCGIPVEDYAGCTIRAYWTCLDPGGFEVWNMMRELQLP